MKHQMIKKIIQRKMKYMDNSWCDHHWPPGGCKAILIKKEIKL